MAGHLLVVLLACSIVVLTLTTAHETCGVDDAAEALRLKHSNVRMRRDARVMDPRYKLPSKSLPLGPSCSYASTIFGYGYSQCFIQSVVTSYMTTTNWPSAAVQISILTYKPESGNGWISAGQAAASMSIVNAAFASSGISFSYSYVEQVNQTAVDYYNNNPLDVNSLDSVYSWLQADFGIASRQADRSKALYVDVIPTNNNTFTGLCFPLAGMLEQINIDIPSNVGGICIVNPQAFLAAAQGGFTFSNGYTTAHEIGHALGLQHPHMDVPQRLAIGSSSCTALSISSNCYATSNIYDTGDYISDIPPTPNPQYYAVGIETYTGDVFNVSKCAVGPSFPAICGTSSVSNLTSAINNYMSYYPESCGTTFSPMQIARMRCAVDRYLDIGTGIVTARRLPPVALVSAVRLSTTSVKVEWVAPVNFLATAGSSLPTPAGTNFVVQRTPSFVGFSEVVVPVSVYNYTDTNANVTISYSYRVFGRNSLGDGAQSASVTTTTSASAALLASLPLLLTLSLVSFLF